MAVTTASTLARIRSRLTEQTARFYSDSSTNGGILDWYNAGCQEQHRIVLAAARQANRLRDTSDPYLRAYATFKPIPILVGTQQYPLPADFMEFIQFSIADIQGLQENPAQLVDGDEEWFVKHVPQLGPTFIRPVVSVNVDASTSHPAIQVFLMGQQWGKPNSPWSGKLYYYRDILAATNEPTPGTVDVADPYNEGPIWYAVAMAYERRGVDPSEAFGLFRTSAQAILQPTASSDAVGKEAQTRSQVAQLEAQMAKEGK